MDVFLLEILFRATVYTCVCVVFYGAVEESAGWGTPHVCRTSRPIRQPGRIVLRKKMWKCFIVICLSLASGGRKSANGVQGRSPSPEAEAVCTHCLQILTAETIKIWKLIIHHLLIFDQYVSRWGRGWTTFGWISLQTLFTYLSAE